MATEAPPQPPLPGAEPRAAELAEMQARANRLYLAWKEASKDRAAAQAEEKKARKDFERQYKAVCDWTGAEPEGYAPGDDDDDDGTDE